MAQPLFSFNVHCCTLFFLSEEKYVRTFYGTALSTSHSSVQNLKVTVPRGIQLYGVQIYVSVEVVYRLCNVFGTTV